MTWPVKATVDDCGRHKPLSLCPREDSPWQEAAYKIIEQLSESRAPWAIPWPCLHEFIAIVTHPRIYNPPTPLAAALDQVDSWIESPSLNLIRESEGYWPHLKSALEQGLIAGPKVHDARIAAICLLHGVRELWTADRDFSRFPTLTTRNPLIIT